MKNLSIGKKITMSFGIILILLSLVAIISFAGVSSIVKNADQVITGNTLDRNLAQKEVDHLNWVQKVNSFLLSENSTNLEVEVDDHKCAFGKWLFGVDRKKTEKQLVQLTSLLNEIEVPHRILHQSAIAISNSASKEEANEIYVNQTVQALENVQKLLKKIRETAKANIITDAAMLNSAGNTKLNIIIVGCVAIALGIALALFNTQGITKVLQQVSTQISNMAEQVATSSRQVSSSSKIMAEGASEQAAGIEETSSFIEEMSSMTQQNSDNANKTNILMTETIQIMDDTNNAMKDLNQSMNEISNASENTARIIKTIDEIAFQTNLLALNAAVEAARAGEAGSGFAVVADEVRNLAMRAAKAAKDTADLIDGTVKKIKNGSEIVIKTNEAFLNVATSSNKVGELVNEIAIASREQAKGIEQVNRAMMEMDKVVQQNASGAEESSSVSNELNSQAEHLKKFADNLVALINGKNGQCNMNSNNSNKKIEDNDIEANFYNYKSETHNLVPAYAKT